MVSISGAFSTPLGEPATTVGPLGGCELAGEWEMITRKATSVSLVFGQWYIYHPHTRDEEDMNNMQIFYSGLGYGINVVLGTAVPFTVGCTLLGGAAIGIINNDVYTEPVVLINPGIAVQARITYGLSDLLVLAVKAQYLTVVDSAGFADWYKEMSVSAGIGMRF